MKTRQIITLLVAMPLALTLAACGNKGASSPTEAFKAFYQASKDGDAKAMKSMLSKRSVAQVESEARSKAMSLDDYLAAEAPKGLPETMPEVGAEKIEGDRASVQVKYARSIVPTTIYFVKEDGYWKIDFR